jgi:hypothetical protein
VGHQLPAYFLNAIASVRHAAPDDELLVIDNASPDLRLRAALSHVAEADELVHLILRGSNEITRNAKVGGLYDAYHAGVSFALERGFQLLHVLQGDMQMLWWDQSVVSRAIEIFTGHPECVNVTTLALSRDRHTADLAVSHDGLVIFREYGLTDCGLLDLQRWRALNMKFGPSESFHARHYHQQGLRAIAHPWPTVAPVPWPPVVRRGRVRGHEVQRVGPFLLRPLGEADVAAVKVRYVPATMEDVCTPWGWSYLTPIWPTGLESIDYLVFRYRDARANGMLRAVPRWERSGLDSGQSLWSVQRRPTAGDVARFVTHLISGAVRGATGLFASRRNLQRTAGIRAHGGS